VGLLRLAMTTPAGDAFKVVHHRARRKGNKPIRFILPCSGFFELGLINHRPLLGFGLRGGGLSTS
jgi:hypothetical protein